MTLTPIFRILPAALVWALSWLPAFADSAPTFAWNRE